MTISDESILLGKILGEIYRLQRNADMPCCASDEDVYGLLNGFENVVEEQLGRVTKNQFKVFEKLIQKFDVPEDERKEPRGFYAVEKQLAADGVDRATVIKLLRYYKATGHCDHIVQEFDTSNSPGELRNIRVAEYDK